MNLLRKLTLVVCVMGFCILSVNTASGICPPCNDCIYEPAEWPLVVNHNGCSFYVYYDTCDGDGSKIKINSINPVPGNPNCDPALIDQWIRYAAMEAFANGHWIMNHPDPGFTDYDFTVKIPACMKYDGSNFVPCSTTDCCEETYNILMIDGCPTVQYRKLPNNCVCPNPAGGCTNACDDIIFEDDECLRVWDPYCDLYCSSIYSAVLNGKYIPGDNTSQLEVWENYVMDNDTLCVNLNKVFYDIGNGQDDPVFALTRAIEKTLWDLYLRQWGQDQNIHYIRVTTPACYTKYNTGTNKYELVPCYDWCCSTLYPVTWNGSAVVLAGPPVHVPDPDPGCAAPPDDCSISACQIDVWNTSPAEKAAVYQGNDHNRSIISYVKPNPAEDQLDIILMSEGKGTYQTKIFDVNGNEVYKFDFRKAGHEAIYQLNTSGFNSGIYTYHIMNGDIVIFSGKFMIVR